MKKHFHNAEEFIAYCSEVLPMITEVDAIARERKDGAMLKQTKKLRLLFANDAALLREAYRQMAKPDGSCEFSWTADAAALLAKYA